MASRRGEGIKRTDCTGSGHAHSEVRGKEGGGRKEKTSSVLVGRMNRRRTERGGVGHTLVSAHCLMAMGE